MTLPRVLPAPLDEPWPEIEVDMPHQGACLLGWLLWGLIVATGLTVGAGGAWLVLRRYR